MKKLLLYLSFCLVMFYSGYYLISQNINSNLKKNNHLNSENWKKVTYYLVKLDIKFSKVDKNYYPKYVNYPANCTLLFLEEEYLKNKYMTQVTDTVSNFDVKKSIETIVEDLNKSIEEYNSDVKNSNLYLSQFPNFIFARKLKIKRSKLFTIKYGVDNESPTVKREKIIQRLKDIENQIDPTLNKY
jgi:hypothetical protein